MPVWRSRAQRNLVSGSRFLPLILICAFAVAPSTCAQSDAITLPRNIGELVSESQVVVQGWVTAVTLEPHEQLRNLMTVVVTLQVEETLKGETLKTLTFRQAVIDKRDQQQHMGYQVGQHVLLVLMKPSKFGLTSPAGMEQGRFQVESPGAGKLYATNGLRNAGLFRGLDSQLKVKGVRITPEVHDMVTKHGVGSVPLEQLKSLIRAIVATDSAK